MNPAGLRFSGRFIFAVAAPVGVSWVKYFEAA